MLWQAVELSRVMDRPNLATLQIARKALEPPDDPLEQVYITCCSVQLHAVLCYAALLCNRLCRRPSCSDVLHCTAMFCDVLCCALLCILNQLLQ